MKNMTDDGKFFYQVNPEGEIYQVPVDSLEGSILKLSDEQFAEFLEESEDFNAATGT